MRRSETSPPPSSCKILSCRGLWLPIHASSQTTTNIVIEPSAGRHLLQQHLNPAARAPVYECDQAWQKYMIYRYDTSMAPKWRHPIHTDTSIDTDLYTWCLRLGQRNTYTFDLCTTLRIILICLYYYLVQNPILFLVLYTFYYLND